MAGKKRKATSAPAAKEHVPDDSSKRTRMRIKTYEDVAGSDDEFHLNRDKVMLDDGPEAKRRRKVQEEEAFLEQSDEEVLGYSSPSEAEDEDDDLHADEPGKAPSKNSKGADDEDEDEQEEDEDEVGGWGTTKQDYYDADVIETEQDALDEEKEALRLQKKQLQGMSAADYGFDESEWQQEEGDEAGEKEEGDVVTEVLPQLELDENLSAGERLKLLKSRYPEFEPLSKELLTLNETYTDLCQQKSPSTATKTKQQAAAAYLASLTMYFALLTSTAEHSQTNGLALSATAIRDHPVMDSLIQCRDLWTTLKDLPDEEPEEETALDLSEEDAMSEDEPVVLDIKPKAHKEKKTKAQRTLEYAEKEAAARRAERLARTEADFDDLNALTTGLASRKTKKPTAAAMAAAAAAAAENSDSDFGEDTTLTSQELAEKAKRKKSLRFYTSQIAQKANRRGAAGRNAGGDDDLPYRERLRDRQTRLNAEATARGRNQPGDDLGASDEDEDDRRAAKDVRGDQEDEYYDFIAAKNTLKKTEKAALAAAQKEAEASGGRVVPQETVGKDGKRAITYAIEKNKGLTPHRKKDVRNPRVKKRKKFEEKKKKLASIKPVYKGGEGRGGYGGELTGIKKGLVRSTKLS